MSLIRIDKNPSGRQLAIFGAAWLVFFSLAGWLSWSRGRHATAETLWVAAALVPLAGTASRKAIRLAYVGLSYATYPIGIVVSHVALALVYYLALMPIGLTMRLFGHDPLSRKFDPTAKSYWKTREGPRPPASYFDQS
jgi:Saxitoxin biosynthesis operon protein SxtJ